MDLYVTYAYTSFITCYKWIVSFDFVADNLTWTKYIYTLYIGCAKWYDWDATSTHVTLHRNMYMSAATQRHGHITIIWQCGSSITHMTLTQTHMTAILCQQVITLETQVTTETAQMRLRPECIPTTWSRRLNTPVI